MAEFHHSREARRIENSSRLDMAENASYNNKPLKRKVEAAMGPSILAVSIMTVLAFLSKAAAAQTATFDIEVVRTLGPEISARHRHAASSQGGSVRQK